MTSPLELLTDRKNRQTTFLGDNWAPLSCGTVAFIGVCFVRYGTRRPLFSGIQKHVVVTALATGFGKVVGNWYNQYMADRDSILRHYIELHPEDFPTPERKTFGEIMQRWVPIR